MSFYIIKNDGFEYKEFALDQDDYLDFVPEDTTLTFEQLMRFGLHDVTMGGWWQEVEAKFTTPVGLSGLPTPDLHNWLEAAIVLSENAYNTLSEKLGECGELLPVKADGARYWIFNCLNYDASKFAYKTKFDSCSSLYCSDEMKSLCEKENLVGVIFSTSPHNPFG